MIEYRTNAAWILLNNCNLNPGEHRVNPVIILSAALFWDKALAVTSIEVLGNPL